MNKKTIPKKYKRGCKKKKTKKKKLGYNTLKQKNHTKKYEGKKKKLQQKKLGYNIHEQKKP